MSRSIMYKKSKFAELLDQIRINRTAYLFLIPVLLLLSLFKYYPFLIGIFKSLFTWNAANVNEFVWFKNYGRLFGDRNFLDSLRNVGIYSAALVAINLTVPLGIALLVSNLRIQRLQNFFKVGFIIPMVVPTVVIILIWKWIFAGDYGILNQFLESVGLEGLTRAWLGDKSTALGAIIFVRFPWIADIPFLIYLAGLQAIPNDIFESCEIEGVGVMRRIFSIDLPLIRSQIKLVVMYMLILAIQVFEQPYIMTGGGPGNSTLTTSLYLYNQGFTYNRFGYASAIGVVLFILILTLTILSGKLIRDTETIE